MMSFSSIQNAEKTRNFPFFPLLLLLGRRRLVALTGGAIGPVLFKSSPLFFILIRKSFSLLLSKTPSPTRKEEAAVVAVVGLCKSDLNFCDHLPKSMPTSTRNTEQHRKRSVTGLTYRNTNVVLDLELLFSIFGLYAFAMNFDVDLSGWSELRVVEEPIQDSGSIQHGGRRAYVCVNHCVVLK